MYRCAFSESWAERTACILDARAAREVDDHQRLENIGVAVPCQWPSDSQCVVDNLGQAILAEVIHTKEKISKIFYRICFNFVSLHPNLSWN